MWQSSRSVRFRHSGVSSGRPVVGEGSYRHEPILIGLRWSVQTINRRINQRVKRMFDSGGCEKAQQESTTEDTSSLVRETLPQEAARLDRQAMFGPQARQAIGYKQVLEHLAGRCTLDDAFEQTKISTRRFAKNQRTWMQRFQGVHWLTADGLEPSALSNATVDILKSKGVLL